MSVHETTRMSIPRTRHGRGLEQRTSRKSKGLTCANCRLRKVRCEGGQPSCKTCEIYNDECRYDKAPPLSQFVAMAKRLEEAEKTIAELRNRPDTALEESIESGLTQGSQASPPQAAIATLTPRLHPPTTSDTDFNTPLGPSTNITASNQFPDHHPLSGRSPREQQGLPELSVDNDGKISYYGPTSAVHDPTSMESPASHVSNAPSSISRRSEMRSYLLSYARESGKWEDFAIGNAAVQTGIPRHLISKLLHLHWTWISPMFMWVYRPAFMRDMITNGPYYSDFLLTVLCAHTAKYEDPEYGQFLLSRARLLLGAAIQQPSSVPTIQALLQLSARDFAHGSISQGWVYSGIAFRMASDLGLQLDCTNIKGLTPVDWEVRRRLFWSCYFWDKATSLYTGRFPAITEQVDIDTLDLLDDSSDDETWNPLDPDSFPLAQLTPFGYPPVKKYAVSCFINSCKLSTIINDIILQLYSRKSKSNTEASLRNIQTQLDMWRAQLPAHLALDPENLPSVCPPPHIITQNLLFYATTILANRPLWSTPVYYQKCITAASNMGKLVLLLESQIGLERVTYLMCYSVYTGASAILEDARKGSGAAHTTLQTFLRVLKAGMKTCPLVERSLNTIFRSLNRPSSQDIESDITGQYSNPAANSVLPVFPYVDMSETTYSHGMMMDPKDMLNCYPELDPNLSGLIASPLV